VDLKYGLSHSKLKPCDLWCDVQLLTVFWEFKTRDGAHSEEIFAWNPFLMNLELVYRPPYVVFTILSWRWIHL
jgi:hypothetical protein